MDLVIKNEEVDVWAVVKKYLPQLHDELKKHKQDGIAFSQDAYYGNSLAEIILIGCTVKAAGNVGREVMVAPHGSAFPEGGKKILFDPEIEVIDEGHVSMHGRPESMVVAAAQEAVKNEKDKT